MASPVTCFLSLTLLLGELMIGGGQGLKYVEGVGTPGSVSLPGTRRPCRRAPRFGTVTNIVCEYAPRTRQGVEAEMLSAVVHYARMLLALPEGRLRS